MVPAPVRRAISASVGLVRRTGGLSLATFGGQALMMVNFLLLGRLLGDEGLGHYSLLLSYATMVASVNLMSVDVSLPGMSQASAARAAGFALLLLIGTSALVLAVALVLGYRFGLALVFFSFALGANRLAEKVSIRNGRFRLIAWFRLIPALMLALAVAVAVAFDAMTVEAVIAGASVFYFGQSLAYLKLSFSEYRPASLKAADIRAVVGELRQTMLLITPASLASSAAYQLPVVLIERFFGAGAAGQYSLVLRLCFGPVLVIGNAIGNHFHADIGRDIEHRGGANLDALARRLSRALKPLAVITALTIFFLFSPVVSLLYGPGWQMAGDISRLMAPMFGIMLLVSPLSVIVYAARKGRVELVSQTAFLLIAAAAFLTGAAFDNLLLGTALFSALASLRFLVLGAVFRRIARQPATA